MTTPHYVFELTFYCLIMIVELHLTRTEATAVYYGIDDVRTRNNDERVLGSFVVQDKANKLSRPVARGNVTGGALAKRG